jgi:hypothetical protein
VRRLLRFSAALTLVGLALMLWSMLAPTPMPVMLAMTLGQALGTIAFGLYLYVIYRDYRRLVRIAREGREHPVPRDSLNVIPVVKEPPVPRDSLDAIPVVKEPPP